VAEDLGVITPEVTRLRERYGLPGMKVLQFAFDGGADNPYLPHNHVADSVVYTGTHDNDTSLSWFESLPDESRHKVREYLGHPGEPMPRPLVRAALASVARLAIVPMQDVLGLGAGQRMNTPGTTDGNWRWRFDWEQLSPDIAGWFRRTLGIYGRV
jgi:4-alpha-glucanotransferase